MHKKNIYLFVLIKAIENKEWIICIENFNHRKSYYLLGLH